jgi:hypothetical protein
MADKLSRRDVLRQSAAFGVVAAFGAAACGKEKHAALSCMDTSSLSSADAQLRTTLAYADISTEPGKSCALCQQFVPAPTPDTCGTCKILKGPINPNGNCKSFVAKPL